MKRWTEILAATAISLATASTASATTIDFDEFTSPPVDCCYGNPVVGPLVYSTVTITDTDGAGQVMNGDGWNQNQTSGFNLFGTRTDSIKLIFTSGVSNLRLDVIEGTSGNGGDFTLSLFDAGDQLIGSVTHFLAGYGGSGPDAPNVGNFFAGISGIYSATITTDDPDKDIAIDTVSFDTADSGVPEPMTLALFGAGLAGLGSLRRKKSV